MDELAIGAISAVWHSDTSAAERWFNLLREQYLASAEAERPDWSSFQYTLQERASSEGIPAETVEGFCRYLDDYSSAPLDVVAQLADPTVEAEVLQTYSAALEAAWEQEASEAESETQPVEPEGEVIEVAFDDSAWAEYLGRWTSQWDGSPDTWAAFRERFTDDADRSVAGAAEELMAYAESQPDPAAALEPYGLVATLDAAVEPEPAEPDAEPPAEPATATEPEAEAQAVTDSVILPALAEALQEVPEALDLSDEELQELLMEILDEELGEQVPPG